MSLWLRCRFLECQCVRWLYLRPRWWSMWHASTLKYRQILRCWSWTLCSQASRRAKPCATMLCLYRMKKFLCRKGPSFASGTSWLALHATSDFASKTWWCSRIASVYSASRFWASAHCSRSGGNKMAGLPTGYPRKGTQPPARFSPWALWAVLYSVTHPPDVYSEWLVFSVQKPEKQVLPISK